MNIKTNFSMSIIRCENIILILYFIGLLLIPINTGSSNKIINLSGMISFLIVITNYKKYFTKNNYYLFLSILALGMLNLSWYFFHKHFDSIYKNGYRGYLEVGKMFIFSSFSFLIFSSCYIKNKINYYLLSAILAQLLIVTRAFYQGLYLDASRIPLSAMGGKAEAMGAATIAAYMITFCAIYTAIVIMKSTLKHKWILFYLSFILNFSAIIMTGTRSAIFTYPLMTFLLLFIHYKKQKAFLLRSLLAAISLLLICGFIFNKAITDRIDYITSDITHYSHGDSSTSVGARLSMIRAGFASASLFTWQSLEQRADKVQALCKEDKTYQGAMDYLNIHMHNEVAEAISTKGIWGVLFVLALYLSLILFCIKTKNFLLIVFPLSMILFGISDVVIHAKPIPAAWILTFYLSIAFLNGKQRELHHLESHPPMTLHNNQNHL